ncbi:MAG: hypothetical protein MJ154_01230 [Candidatus Saccharibacteria bacterium]|nr:hypothetical protein [Candidatus Saccharibacteria bacterium]
MKKRLFCENGSKIISAAVLLSSVANFVAPYLPSAHAMTLAGQSAAVTLDSSETHTLSNVNIESTSGPAITIPAGENVTLVLEGENYLKGAPGYAAIYVAKGATLTISGEGKLTAIGGEGIKYTSKNLTASGAGAGIGGNGAAYERINNANTEVRDASCGEIIIESGEIIATGGQAKDGNYASGAGIGTGGTSASRNTSATTIVTESGKVTINGGSITATGGAGEVNSETGGGAGIGAGGTMGGAYGYGFSKADMGVEIHGGTIVATGGNDGAGIGSGANTHMSSVVIDGDANVTANGTGESSGRWGGAGIGGGDNGNINSIAISGSAKVVAKAAGAAAGIGGGNDGSVADIRYDESEGDAIIDRASGNIEISGNADVAAYGNVTSKGFGGAAIGAGISYYVDSSYGNISILDNAKVLAYAFSDTQVIGGHSYYEDDYFGSVEISKTANVSMFSNNSYNPFAGLDENAAKLSDTLNLNGATLVWYDAEIDTLCASDGVDILDGIEYSFEEGTLTISKDGEQIYKHSGFPQDFELASWAVIIEAEETPEFIELPKTYDAGPVIYLANAVILGAILVAVNKKK